MAGAAGTEPWTPSAPQSWTEAPQSQVGPERGARWTPGFGARPLFSEPTICTLCIQMAANKCSRHVNGKTLKASDGGVAQSQLRFGPVVQAAVPGGVPEGRWVPGTSAMEGRGSLRDGGRGMGEAEERTRVSETQTSSVKLHKRPDPER